MTNPILLNQFVEQAAIQTTQGIMTGLFSTLVYLVIARNTKNPLTEVQFSTTTMIMLILIIGMSDGIRMGIIMGASSGATTIFLLTVISFIKYLFQKIFRKQKPNQEKNEE